MTHIEKFKKNYFNEKMELSPYKKNIIDYKKFLCSDFDLKKIFYDVLDYKKLFYYDYCYKELYFGKTANYYDNHKFYLELEPAIAAYIIFNDETELVAGEKIILDIYQKDHEIGGMQVKKKYLIKAIKLIEKSKFYRFKEFDNYYYLLSLQIALILQIISIQKKSYSSKKIKEIENELETRYRINGKVGDHYDIKKIVDVTINPLERDAASFLSRQKRLEHLKKNVLECIDLNMKELAYECLQAIVPEIFLENSANVFKEIESYKSSEEELYYYIMNLTLSQ